MSDPRQRHVVISIPEQRLRLVDGDETTMDVSVSTARNGPGERLGSECTPRGWHVVRAKIGGGCPANTVFEGRRPTGERYTPDKGARNPDRDWVLTRILWLSGMERGRNRLGEVDTMRRFIYIHGTPDDRAIGMPGSHGCIRMRNSDVIKLFDEIPVGTRVLIQG